MKDIKRALEPLRRIRACLHERKDKNAIAHIDELIRLGDSRDALDNLSFQAGLKDRYLWLGPCTLLDNVSVSGEQYRALLDALIEVARACKVLDLETDASREALRTYLEERRTLGK